MTQTQTQLENLSPQKRALLEKLLAKKKEQRGRPEISIPRRDPSSTVPLSLAQQRLWITYLLDPESAAYNISKAIRVDEVDVAVLETALVRIVNRHETLRTTFNDAGGVPHQVIGREDAFRLENIDLGAMAGEELEEAVRGLAIEDRRRPFDLRRGPLFRATLVHSVSARYLLLCIHHIISDAWSLGVLAKELKTLCLDPLASLPDLPIQFGDYATWQQASFQGEKLTRELDYWRHKLADPSVLQLVTDRPRPARQTFRGAKMPVRIERRLVERLEALARQENATLFQVLLAGYGALLRRYTRQEDILVGVPVSTRDQVSLEALIGFFVNTLPLRLDLADQPDFRALVRRVKETAMEAFEHQEVPLEKIVEAVQPQHDPSRSPLFQTLFVLQTAKSMEQGQSLGSGPKKQNRQSLGAMEQAGGTAQFDLSLSLSEKEPGLAGSLEYNCDLFDASTVERLVGHFLFLLETASAEPDRPLHDLPLLAEAERQEILHTWNAGRVDIPSNRCIHHFLEEQAAATPDRKAYLFGDRSLTYGQANGKANALAKSLMSRGIGRGSFVPVILDRGLEVPVAFLAVMKTGAAMVPLDIRWPAERLRSVVEKLDAELVLAARGGALAEDLGERLQEVDLDGLRVDGENPRVEIEAEDPVYVIFTSGSTGTPKGAMCLHKGVMNRLLWMGRRYRPTPDDVILQTTYHCFDSSFWQLFWPQLHGGCSVLPEQTLGLDPLYGIDLLARHGVTITDFVPAEFDAVVQVLFEDPEGAEKIQRLRQLIIGGEAINPKTVFEFRRHFPWVEMVNSYGPTETTIGVLSFPIPRQEVPSLPIGRPQENVFTFITDGHLRPVPVGVPGELLLGGDCVGGGYVKDPERTDAVFLESPFPEICQGKVYRSGDLVRYRPDGNIEFLGRIDHQIKIRGYRIEPGEIEARLLAHRDVREALVMAREDRPGWLQLVAYVTGVELESEDLRAFIGKTLPSYMVPSAVVVLESMPMTANGKVNRSALPAPALEERADRVMPRTAAEEDVAALWRELLDLEEVGVEESFFDLGGHSLLATRLGFRLRETFQIEVPLRDLFEYPTVAEQAQLIEDQRTVRELGSFEDALEEDEEEVLL